MFMRVGTLVDELANIAKGLKLDLTAADMQKACRIVMKSKLTVESDMVFRRIEGLAKKIEGAEVNRGLVVKMMRVIPGLKDELKACKTRDEFQATLDKFEPQIENRMRLSAQVKTWANKAPDMLVDEYVKLTGVDRDKMTSLLALRLYNLKEVEPLLNQMNNDEVKIESEKDIENAFRKLAKDYVAQHQALAQGADNLQGIPDKAREHLRFAALITPRVKDFTFRSAQFANQLDLKPLKTVLAGHPLKMEDAVKALRDLYVKMNAIGLADIGDERTWRKMGPDGKQPYASVMFKCALANDMELLKALNAHVNELNDAVTATFSNKDNDISVMHFAAVAAITELYEDMA